MKQIAIVTTAIELVTLFFRFVLGLESTKHTASTIGKLTFGIRIHHGYIGLLLLIISFFIRKSKFKVLADSHRYIRILGWSLFISDIIHHCILLVVTGSSDFDLVY